LSNQKKQKVKIESNDERFFLGACTDARENSELTDFIGYKTVNDE